MKMLKTSERELNYLTQEQRTHLLADIQSSPIATQMTQMTQMTQIIKICLTTGARITEAIDLKGAQVTKHKITFINTKGKRNRTVSLSEDLYNEIY